jgi:pimeloyl-ACP methyl ester carboxylesterase
MISILPPEFESRYNLMMAEPSNFDPNEFAKWLYDGLKETIAYRLKQTFNREKLIEQVQAKIPNQNQVLHFVLRQAFEASGFKFEELKQGDANFYLIRKKIRVVEPGIKVRRLVMIPGFGDTPASWMPLYGLVGRDLVKNFDEIILIDFPGYTGFLSHQALIPSMRLLQGLVKTVCEANPPTVLMGHSLGGWLASKVAQELSEPIEHLLVIAPSGLTPDESERRDFGDFIINNENLHLDEILNLVMHEPGNLKMLINEDVKRFFSKPEIKMFINSVKPDDFVNPELGFKAQKVTVIWGENDQFVPSQWIRYWVEHYGNYLDAFLMKETGHLPQLERPMVLAQVINQALFNESSNLKSGDYWIKIQSRQKEFDFKNVSQKQSNLLESK